MANILLLGAGFSANWGAPVTSGVFNALIADPEVRGDRPMHDLLWRNRGNFENALAALQENFRRDQQMQREPLLLMQRAIQRTFERINGIFTRQSFELQDGQPIDRNRTVVEFLAKFDAIFTLNQDFLLEIHYFDHTHNVQTNRRWNGGCVPGMGLLPVRSVTRPSGRDVLGCRTGTTQSPITRSRSSSSTGLQIGKIPERTPTS